ncbi:MAG: mobile mystery protein A [Mariprofundaceae bacterium]|nr:mobile mystery protein A [Mariprofundaceae bacterium]
MAIQQLDRQLSELKSLKSIQLPVRGWLRAIRDVLGMSGPQMARRMSVTKQRISLMEKAEVNGSATLNSMRQAAEALDCVFVYAVLPRDSLQGILERQARKLVQREQAYTAHTMLIEDQLPSGEEQREAMDAAVTDIIRRLPKQLWD